MSDPTPPVFLSHSHADKKLATCVKMLVEKAVHCKVFCTSRVQDGLPFGGNFDDIHLKLKESRLVLGLITRNSLKSQPALSEMAVGRDQGKLVPLLARSGYGKLLRWPFESKNCASLDSPEHVEQLVTELIKRMQRVPGQTGEWRAEKESVVTQARRYWPSYGPRVQQSVAVLAISLAAISGYWFGISKAVEPARTVVLDSNKIPVGSAQVRVAFTETLPTRLLSERLGSLKRYLPIDEKPTERARKLFRDVLREANETRELPMYHRFDAKQLDLAEKLIEAWNGESGDGVPKERYDGCKSLGDVNKPWCELVNEIFQRRDEKKEFDNIVFAVLQTDSSPEWRAIVPKQQWDFAGAHWRVEFIGTSPERANGGVVLQEILEK